MTTKVNKNTIQHLIAGGYIRNVLKSELINRFPSELVQEINNFYFNDFEWMQNWLGGNRYHWQHGYCYQHGTNVSKYSVSFRADETYQWQTFMSQNVVSSEKCYSVEWEITIKKVNPHARIRIGIGFSAYPPSDMITNNGRRLKIAGSGTKNQCGVICKNNWLRASSTFKCVDEKDKLKRELLDDTEFTMKTEDRLKLVF
eukprot:277971_1